MSSSTSREVSRGVKAGEGELEISAGLGGGAQQDLGRGVKTNQWFGVRAGVSIKFKEIEDTSPQKYLVSLIIDLRGEIGGGAGKGGGQVSLSMSGAFTKMYTREFTADKATAYLDAAKSGQGGLYEELKVIQTIAKGGFEAGRAYLAQTTAQGRDITQMAPGEVVTTTTETGVGGSVGGSRGGAGVHLGASRSGKVTRSESYVDGKAVITISIVDDTGTSIGGGVTQGVASADVSFAKSKSKTVSLTFAIDPNDKTRLSKLRSVTSVEELQKLRALWRDYVTSDTTGHGRTATDTTTAGILGVGVKLVGGSHYAESQTVDDQGRVTHQYESGGSGGAALTAGDTELYKGGVEESFTAEVGPDNKASGEVTTATSETDVTRSAEKLISAFANKPLQTVAGVATGGTKLIQQRTDVSGKKLSNENFQGLVELAQNPIEWAKKWDGNMETRAAWIKLGAKLRAIGPDDSNKIAKAVAEYQEGYKRSSTLEAATQGSGISFEFPDEIADQKPVYDKLVAGDPLAFPRKLVEEGKSGDAIAQLNRTTERLAILLAKIKSQDKSITPAKLTEMMQRITARQTEVRAELRKLSPPVAKVEPLPEGFIGPPSADQAAAAEEERAAKQNEILQQINGSISTLQSNQRREAAVFADVEAEFAKKEKWFAWTDFDVINKRLNSLPQMYSLWDQEVTRLRELYQSRGESPDQAAQYAPNRARYKALYNQAYAKWGTPMQ